MTKYSGDPKGQDLSKLSDGIVGECLCGNIRVTITKTDLFTKPNGHLCHCAVSSEYRVTSRRKLLAHGRFSQNCRKSSGSAAANNLVVDKHEASIEDPNGMLKT